MLIDTHAHEEPPWSIRLERESEEDETELQLVEEILAAGEALGVDWLKPLALHLSIGCYDTNAFYAPSDCGPATPQWFRHRTPLPPGVDAKPIYAGAVVDAVSTFTGESIREWIAQALAQECPDPQRFIPSWRELWWPAVRAKIPESTGTAGLAQLQVRCHTGTVSVPVETEGNETWVCGPFERYVMGPPAELIAYNEDGVIAIHLRVYWDLWITEPAGRAQVEAAVDRVLALGRGWQRAER